MHIGMDTLTSLTKYIGLPLWHSIVYKEGIGRDKPIATKYILLQ